MFGNGEACMKPDFLPVGVLSAPFDYVRRYRETVVTSVGSPINTFLGIHGTTWSRRVLDQTRYRLNRLDFAILVVVVLFLSTIYGQILRRPQGSIKFHFFSSIGPQRPSTRGFSPYSPDLKRQNVSSVIRMTQ